MKDSGYGKRVSDSFGQEKRKPLLNEHVKAGFLESEFLFEWEAIRQCFVFTKVFEWSNPSTNQMQTKITSDLVTHFARASGNLPVFSLSSPFTKFCQIKQCIYLGQSGLPIGPKRL